MDDFATRVRLANVFQYGFCLEPSGSLEFILLHWFSYDELLTLSFIAA
jgi:hypothetical protein